MIQTPSLLERAQQGREVGYAIIAVGTIGILIAIWKLIELAQLGKAVRNQANSKVADSRNPLEEYLRLEKIT